MPQILARAIAETLVLGAGLEHLKATFGTYELLAHWTQGEFHHDVVLRVDGSSPATPSNTEPTKNTEWFVVIATNCNGGIKEVLFFDQMPERYALWRWRCPHVADFTGELAPIHARAVTAHWFDPCEILAEDARSELREEFRDRQKGGGWVCRKSE